MRHEPKTYAALLIALAVLLISPAAYAVTALEEWNAAARDALVTPVKVWLGLMMLTNIAAIGFLKNHVAARWVFAGFVISHGLVIAMSAQGMAVLAGQVSLFHIIFWTPGMIMLLRHRNEIQYPKVVPHGWQTEPQMEHWQRPPGAWHRDIGRCSIWVCSG